MLSVFITPCTNPMDCQPATILADLTTTSERNAPYPFPAISGMWLPMTWSASEAMVASALLAASISNVPNRTCESAVRHFHLHGRFQALQKSISRACFFLRVCSLLD